MSVTTYGDLDKESKKSLPDGDISPLKSRLL
jgi:hypothetical protein